MASRGTLTHKLMRGGVLGSRRSLCSRRIGLTVLERHSDSTVSHADYYSLLDAEQF